MKRLLVATATVLSLGTAALVLASPSTDLYSPPALNTPDGYMTNTVTVSLNAPKPDVRDFMAQTPLTQFLQPSGNIPKITDITVLSGEWGVSGSVRRVDLEGGFHVHERVLTNTPDAFTYQIWDISTPSGRFIDHIHGEILFSETDGGTTITWNYNVDPAYFFARPAIQSYLEDDFAPFMAGGMDRFVQAYLGSG